MAKKLIVLLLLCWLGFSAFGFDHNHSQFNTLLNKHVTPSANLVSSKVNYAGFKQDIELLNNYISSLEVVSKSEFDNWNKTEQLALLINYYNAATIKIVLTVYPEIESIKQLGSLFSSVWSKEFILLFEKLVSLDDIEHIYIRGSEKYNDYRIHFAVNCASVGCPKLREEAYSAKKLDAQLEDQTSLFLQDKSRNRFQNGRLMVSKIFKWYKIDFEKGNIGISSLAGFFARYYQQLALSKDNIELLKSNEIDIEFLDYDWSLNS